MASCTSVKYLSPSSAAVAVPSGVPVGNPSRSGSGFSSVVARVAAPARACRINSAREGARGGGAGGLRAGAGFTAGGEGGAGRGGGGGARGGRGGFPPPVKKASPDAREQGQPPVEEARRAWAEAIRPVASRARRGAR